MIDMETSFHAVKAPVAQPLDDEELRRDALVIPGASGVAVPVSNWTSEQFRDLVSANTIRNLSEALGEPEPL
jgi:hypothetical protein